MCPPLGASLNMNSDVMPAFGLLPTPGAKERGYHLNYRMLPLIACEKAFLQVEG